MAHPWHDIQVEEPVGPTRATRAGLAGYAALSAQGAAPRTGHT